MKMKVETMHLCESAIKGLIAYKRFFTGLCSLFYRHIPYLVVNMFAYTASGPAEADKNTSYHALMHCLVILTEAVVIYW